MKNHERIGLRREVKMAPAWWQARRQTVQVQTEVGKEIEVVV